jgi:hypothetical protein
MTWDGAAGTYSVPKQKGDLLICLDNGQVPDYTGIVFLAHFQSTIFQSQRKIQIQMLAWAELSVALTLHRNRGTFR